MFNKLVKYLDPKESLLSITKEFIHIYNYNKIIDISNNMVKIMLDNKLNIINGSDFKIIKMENDELLIKGSISNIEIK